jgi:hypothetical protein
MHLDARGLPILSASGKAAAAYGDLVTGYLTQRAGTPARLTALLEVDPDFALAHCMQGLALGSLVDCEFRNEGATLRSYLVTLARINV